MSMTDQQLLAGGSMRDRLAGRVIVVTGGGSGLGRAICIALAELGAVVVPTDLLAARALATAEALAATTVGAAGIELDVTDSPAVAACLRSLHREHGRIDAVINNAGVDVTRSLEELTLEEFDLVLATNLRGPFIVSKAAMPYLVASGGHIVNIVSTAAKRAWANASAYHASKWGLLGLSHALHVEGREQGVKVTALVAGGMRTPFLLDRFPDIDPETLQDPRNVAEAVAFALTQPAGTVVPELTVLPMRETSWP